MGGYATYVWSSYGICAVVLILNIIVFALISTVPVVISLFYHRYKNKIRAGKYEILTLIFFPIISCLPGAMEFRMKVLGHEFHASEYFWGHIILTVVSVTIILNISLQVGNKKNSVMCFWIAIVTACLTNLIFPWYPMC